MSRVAAVVLPELACEVLALREPGREAPPIGVVIGDEDKPSEILPGHAALDVVGRSARRFGVRAGQSVVEATALLSQLVVRRVSPSRVEAALASIADALSPYGRTAALRLADAAPFALARTPGERRLALARARTLGPWDTVWLDVAGVGHLFGGDEALAERVGAATAGLGHHARVVVADGPLTAQAVGRELAWSVRRAAIVEPGRGAAALAPLSVFSLPLDRAAASWLVRLGVFTVADLARVARAEGRGALLARLAAGAGAETRKSAELALALALGEGELPLLPHAPPRVVVEEARFEEDGAGCAVETTTGLLFVLSRLLSRAVERLAARGEAATRVALRARHDRGVARARAAELGLAAPPEALEVAIDMASPVSKKEEIFRALELRLERAELFAPVVDLAVELSELAPAARWQLDLGRTGAADETRLPALLAELSSEIGADRVGILGEVDAHRVEERTRLERIERLSARPLGGRRPPPQIAPDPAARLEASLGPTRVLPEPVPVGAVDWARAQADAVVLALPEGLFRASRARFWQRQEGLGWWSEAPTSRDYFRVWLEPDGPSGSPGRATEALVFVDRKTGRSYLQGYWE